MVSTVIYYLVRSSSIFFLFKKFLDSETRNFSFWFVLFFSNSISIQIFSYFTIDIGCKVDYLPCFTLIYWNLVEKRISKIQRSGDNIFSWDIFLLLTMKIYCYSKVYQWGRQLDWIALFGLKVLIDSYLLLFFFSSKIMFTFKDFETDIEKGHNEKEGLCSKSKAFFSVCTRPLWEVDTCSGYFLSYFIYIDNTS